jgi:hypothetical protein
VKLAFERAEGQVRMRATISVPGGAGVVYTATMDMGNEYYARFVVSALQTQMAETMEAARREAYEQGWKDAKSKRTSKSNWFSSIFGDRS